MNNPLDIFAAYALVGLVSSGSVRLNRNYNKKEIERGLPKEDAEDIAKTSYRIARAMVDEMKKDNNHYHV